MPLPRSGKLREHGLLDLPHPAGPRRLELRGPPAADGQAEPAAADGGVVETIRRRILSVASFVEVGRRMDPGEACDRVYRRLLLTAMTATGSASGAVFHLVGGGGHAWLVEAYGGSDRPATRRSVSLPAVEQSHLAGASVQQISGGRQARWQVLLQTLLPELEPRMLVCLDTAAGPTGFMLLGDRHDGDVFASDEQALLVTLVGLFTILADKIDFSAVDTAEPEVESTAGSPARALEELRERHPALCRYVGQTPAIQQILSDLIGVAETDCPLLLEGESGTGKELVARIAHEVSRSGPAPFEAISCGAIPETLLESELFGHVTGAFTGATRNHRGVFERARGGTVFLDEIGEMAPSAQVKLLRVLQEGCFLPVGGEKLTACSSRVIAATNRDLHEQVQAGTFRQDLYYRLAVFPIRLPPLHERRADVPVLLAHFIERHAAAMGQPVPRVARAARARLCLYWYPGNVRELQNIVRALLVEARGTRVITDDHVRAVFLRHRVEESDAAGATAGRRDTPARIATRGNGREVGRWVCEELSRYSFNIALAERMLEERRRAPAERGQVPVFSRSGLTYYLQGECLRSLADEGWNREAAARRIARDDRLVSRVRGKLDRFVDDALEALQAAGAGGEARLEALHKRFAKLPACYEKDLQRLVEAFDQGRWS